MIPRRNLGVKQKNNMKETVMALALIFFILMIGRTEISLYPFHFRMDGWANVVGYLLIGLGLSFLHLDSRNQGYKDALGYVKEILEKKVKGEQP